MVGLAGKWIRVESERGTGVPVTRANTPFTQQSAVRGVYHVVRNPK